MSRIVPDGSALGFVRVEPRRLDALVASLVALVAAALLSFWSYPALPAEMAGECAVAAGLRPPEVVSPGIWRTLAGAVASFVGVGPLVQVLCLAGRVAMGGAIGFVYLTLMDVLPYAMRLKDSHPVWERLGLRVVAALAALFFATTDGVWKAGQAFSPTTFAVGATIVALWAFIRFLRTGRTLYAYPCALTLGVLAAETPFGWFVAGACLAGAFVAFLKADDPDLPFFNPLVMQNSKWGFTIVFVLSWLGTVLVDVFTFAAAGGMVANQLTFIDLPLHLLSRTLDELGAAATSTGWICGATMAFAPFLVALLLTPRATDEDRFLPLKTGLVLAVCGLAAFSQLAGVRRLLFWTWVSHPPMVSSQYLLVLFELFTAFAAAFVLAVAGVELFCRNHERIIEERFPELEESADEVRAKRRFLRLRALRPPFVALFLAALAVLAVLGRRQTETRAAMRLVDDFVRFSVTEAGDACWCFTDGGLDDLYRLESARRGGRLAPLAMMPEPGPYWTHVRTRAAADAEDAATLVDGAAHALRTWATAKPGRFNACALQLGFELWNGGGKADARLAPPPAVGGTLARAGMNAADAARGRVAASDFAARALALAPQVTRRVDDALAEHFWFVVWRLSRLARARSAAFDRAGEAQRSMEEVRLADSLDAANVSLHRMMNKLNWIRRQRGDALTPREGLRVALQRADFSLSRRYAAPLLDADPDDADANFAMGMSYFVEEQFSRATQYLERCLKRTPDEPAVVNNLAICYYRTGKQDKALEFSNRALALLPDSDAVKKTNLQIRKGPYRE